MNCETNLPSDAELDIIHWQLDNITRCGLKLAEAREREATRLKSIVTRANTRKRNK